MVFLKMKEITFLTLICVALSNAEVLKHKRVLTKDLEELKTHHRNEMEALKNEMAILRQEMQERCVQLHHVSTEEHNSKTAMEWTHKALNELRMQIKEVSKKVDSSGLLQQLQSLHNNMNRIVTENTYYMNLARTLEARMDKMDSTVQRLRYDKKNIENMLGVIRKQVATVAKQLKHKLMEEEEMNAEIADNMPNKSPQKAKLRKHRHSKMVHTQLLRLSQAQDQLEASHQSMLIQLLGHQRRIEHLEEPNWELITAKIEFLEILTKSMNERLNNNTLTLADIEKMHSSILELREDLEAIENKMDKTIPEFRKEISKLDVEQAQMNAHFSYVKQDQETLRQSVKAIAVSMSNTQDRAAANRDEIQRINDVVEDLSAQTKKHYYRLNDHILKSEANVPVPEANLTDTVSLPELMGEVKELQPVEREYQDLVAQLPKDCTNITGHTGSYIIRPAHETIDAWCANGTTLIQRRFNGSVEFNRKFADYVHGFGDPTTEYWLGLEYMHQLTADNCSAMRIDMTDIYGASWYAQYESFYVGNADNGYALEVGGFIGNASDAFEYQNHMEFSAIDRDRDISNTHCAGNYEGGWWFSHCQHVNINGKYTLGLTWFDSTRNEWIAVATSDMRVFRRRGCF